jgi:hypothetical protein
MKRFLLNLTLLPGTVSSWGQTVCTKASVEQKKRLSLSTLLTMAFTILFATGWSTLSMAQSSTYYSNGSYTVPPGVTSITITGVGGAGGSGGEDCGNGCGFNPGAPGRYASQVFSVSQGTTLSIYVATNGGNGGSNISGGGAGSGGSGLYSGGSGGRTGSSGKSGGGGGGGGASGVTGSGVFFVAGGGGGGGGRCNTSGSGTAGSTNTGSNGSGTGGTGSSPGGNDGGGGGGGGGGVSGGYGGGLYPLNGESAGYGGNSGSSTSGNSTSSSSPYVTISYTAAGGSASASPSSICSGSSSTISLSGSAGYIQWYYSTDGSTYYLLSGATSSSLNTGALTSTRYYKANVSGVWSSVATVSIYAATGAPSSAYSTGTTQNTASLQWGSGSGNGTITYYWVVGTNSGITYPNGNVAGMYGSTTGLTASSSGLNPNTLYYLKVFASATCGSSGYTLGSFTTVPVAPVANTALNIRANSFTANWAASTSGASGYYLDVSTDNFATYLPGYQNRNVGNVSSCSLSGLNRNTTYYYRIRAYNNGGSSINSNTISFTTLPLNNFLIEQVGGGSIGTQMAGQSFGIKITARDATNTIVTDYNDNATLTTNSTLTAGSPTGNFSSGVLATQAVTLTLSGASKTLTASKVDKGTSVSSTSSSFTVTPAALDHFTLAVNGTITAGTSFTVTATAYDVYNNIKTNYGGASNILNYTGQNNVNWTTTALSAPIGTARIIPANGNQTFTNGVSTIDGFTFYNANQSQLDNNSPTITIVDAQTTKFGTTSPLVVKNSPLDNFKVVADTKQISGTPFDVSVTARDVYWNTCIDYVGSIRFKSSADELPAGQITYPSDLQSFVGFNGFRNFTNGVTIKPDGAYWLRVGDSQYAYKSGEQKDIVVEPGAFLKSASVSVVAIDSPNKIAGEDVVVTLTPRDAQGNLLYSCQDISVLLDGAVKSGTTQVSYGTDGADGVYVFRVPVTSTTAENIISAKLGSVPFDQTYDITVTPAPPSLANTIITPDAGSITTDGSQLVTVQLKDQYNNNRTTDDGVVTLTTNLGGFTGNNGTQATTAIYAGNGTYTANLFASYNATNNGVGTADISGSVAFNATPGPGVWSGAAWPTDGNISDHASVAITEGLPNLVTSTLSTDKSTISTDETATLTIQLKDHLGNLILNNRGTVTLVSDRGVLTNSGYSSNGQYTATLTAGTTPVNGVGLATISGTFTGSGTASTITGNFNNGESTPANTVTTVEITEGLPAVATIDINTTDNQINADGSTLITVQLKDALGNLIVNNKGTVTLSTNLGIIDNGTSTGTADIEAIYTSEGKYSATFKMDGFGVGNATLTGKFNANSISDNAVVEVIPGAATHLAIETQPSEGIDAIAGNPFTPQPVVKVLDQWNNVCTGSNAVVTAAIDVTGTSTLESSGSLSATSALGVATFSGLNYKKAENINIIFTSGSLTPVSSAVFAVVHNVPNYMAISGAGTQTAGVAQTITIETYDAYGNLATGFNGDKTLTFSGANLSPAPPYNPTVAETNFGSATNIHFTNGVATASMTLYKEETADVAANYNGSYSDIHTGTTSVNINAALANRLSVVVGQAAPAYLAITGSTTQIAGDAQTITIKAYDNFNNLASGYTGTKIFKFYGANVSLTPSTSPTIDGVNFGSDVELEFTNGIATATMNLYKVELASIAATDQATSGITTPAGYKLGVTVGNAPASYFAVNATNGTQVAGTSQTITVLAYDQYNNPALDYTGAKSIVFSGASVSDVYSAHSSTKPTIAGIEFGAPTSLTFTSGIATGSLTLYKVESAVIVATTGSITTPDGYQKAVAVTHSTPTYLAVTGSGTQIAGESQDITITAYDAYNNVATGYTGGNLTFSGANLSPDPATNPTVNSVNFGTAAIISFTNGAVTVPMKLYKVETAQVTVSDGTINANSDKLSVVVSHATPDYLTITGAGTQTAGTSQNITIKAFDAYNNPATGYTGNKSLTFSGASNSPEYAPDAAWSPKVNGTAFGSATTLAFSAGVATGTLDLYKVETASVSATDQTINSGNHKLSVIVSQAAPAYIAITGSKTQTAGVSQNITLTAYDAFNNLATNYSGLKNLIFSGAGVSPDGTAPVISGTVLGATKALTFASGAVTTSMNLYKTETAIIKVSQGELNEGNHPLSVLVEPTVLKDFIVQDVPDPHDLGTWQSATVIARDTYQNIKTNYTGRITFSNTDIRAINPADYVFTLADKGVHTFVGLLKFSQPGDWWVTALDWNDPKKYGAQPEITVQRAVTITANDRTKTYGDELTMGSTEFSIAGIVSGVDPVAGEISAVTLTSDGSAATATVGGSPYSIIPSAATGTYTPTYYRIVYENTGKLTVTPANLTITAKSSQTKEYGQSDPALTYDASGFKNSQTVSLMTGNLSRVSGENVGSYGITQGNLSAGSNYTISYIPANFSITAKPITIMATAGQSKIYGNLDPVLSFTSGSLAFSDIFVGTLSRTTGENVGSSYAMKIGTLSIKDGSGINVASNYALSFTPANFAITPLAITVTADAGQSKTYGDDDPTFTYTSIPAVGSVLANGDLISFDGNLSRVPGNSYGTYSITKGSLNNGNYDIAYFTNNFAINKRPITLTANDQNKTYGTTFDLGTTAFARTDGTYASGENATAVVLASEGAINTAISTTYPIVISGATGTGGFLDSNYNITYIPGTLTVDKKELVVTASANQTKVYGEDDPTFTYTATGYENSENSNIFSGKLIRDAGIHVGNSYSIKQGTLSAGNNYYITYNPANFSITQKPVTITATTGQHKTYGDLEPISFRYSTDVALAYSDLFTGTLSRVAGETVGNYAIGQNTLSINDGDGNNVYSDYNITYTGSDFSINPLAVSVTADAGQSKIYGTVDPVLTFISNPSVGSVLANGDHITFDGSLTRATGESVLGGPYAISQGTLKNSNYTITYNSDNFVISPLGITGNFTVDATREYDGGTLSNITGRTLNGVLGTDDVTLSGGIANYDNKNVGIGKTVTLTGMSLTGTQAGNYSLNSVATTTANITVRTLHLSNFAADSKLYDGTTTATGIGFNDDRVSGDNLAFYREAAFEDPNIGFNKNVKYTNIAITGGLDKNNYVLASTTGVAIASILESTITAKITAVDKPYDGDIDATVTLSGNFVPGDAVSITYTSATFDNPKVGSRTVSVTGIALTGADASKYTLAYTTGTATASITAKKLTISGISIANKNYDGTTDATIEGTAALVGVVGSENVTLGGTPVAAFASSAVGNSIPVTVSGYTISGTDAGNYTLTQPTELTANIIVVDQFISLTTGWNIISFNVIPNNQNMLSILQPLVNEGSLLKVMDESGNSIENVGGWLNEIGNSQVSEGYKVKVSQNTTLNVKGTTVALPVNIPLTAGWNIISYPDLNPQNANTLLQDLMTSGKLVKVMDESGNAIENVGGNWLSDIEYMVPGEGYKVKVNANCTLTINKAPKSAVIVPAKVFETTSFNTVFKGNGYDHMNVYLLNLEASGIRLNDEIGVYDGKYCVGAIRIDQKQIANDMVNIPVSSNDGLTETVNGYTKGNVLTLKLHRDGQESNLTYSTLYNSSDRFVAGSSAVLNVSIESNSGTDPLTDNAGLKCYPNPFTDNLSIEVSLPAGTPLHIEIYDVMGRKVSDLNSGISTGYNLIKWNGTDGQGASVIPGVYYVRCNGQVSKGIIKK